MWVEGTPFFNPVRNLPHPQPARACNHARSCLAPVPLGLLTPSVTLVGGLFLLSSGGSTAQSQTPGGGGGAVGPPTPDESPIGEWRMRQR